MAAADLNEKSAAPTPDRVPSVRGSSNGDSTENSNGNHKEVAIDLAKADSKVVAQKDEEVEADPFAHLPEREAKILKDQVYTPDVKVGMATLYRYSSRNDLLIIFVSAICAIASGAALPLMTIIFGNLQGTFQTYFTPGTTMSEAEFNSELGSLVLYFVYLAIGEFVTSYVATVGFIYTGEHISAKIREHYLESCMKQNIGFFDKLGAGEVTTRITADTNLIQEGISEKVGLTLAAVATFVAAFIIGFISFWKLTLILLSTVVALMLCMGTGSRFIVRFSKQNIASYAQGGSIAEEVISSVRNSIAFGTQDRLAKQYDTHLIRAEGFGFKLKSTLGVMIAGMMTILYLNYGLAFWMGSRFLVNGEVPLSKVLIVMMSVMIGAFNLGNVAPNLQAFTTALGAAAKIYSTIDRQSPIDPSSTEGTKLESVAGTIRLEGVKHVYPSRPDVVVMDGVSLTIPAGKTTALVGASGSGKSTIIGLVERFYSPLEGAVYLDDVDISTLNLRWLRQQIALVSQEPTLFGTTIYENIRHGLIGTKWENEGAEKQKELIEDAARKANAHDFITSLPEGYETNVATSALDTKSEGVVQAALEVAAEGRTTITIAHRLSTIKDAHNIVVMSQGQIVEQGTHDELLEKRGAYFNLVTAQAIAAVNEMTVEEEEALEKVESALLRKSSTHKSASGAGVPEDPEDDIQARLNRTQSQQSASSMVLAGRKSGDAKKQYSLGTLIKVIASFNKEEWKLMMIGLFFSAICGSQHPSPLSSIPYIHTETTHVAGLSGSTLGTLIMVSTTLIAACVVALSIGWKLALVCIATMPIVIGCGFFRFWMLAHYQRRAKRAYSGSASYASEAITAMRTVAALTREDDVLNQYKASLAVQQRSSLISVLKSSLLYAASQSFMFLAFALGFWYGGTLIAKYEYNMFQFFIVFSSVIFGAQSAGSVFSFAPDMGKAVEATRELKTLFDRKPVVDTWAAGGEKLESTEGNLEFRDVHFRYPTRPEQPVLRGLNLSVSAGQYVALVGASGCGKSTTIALLERFYDPLAGGIFIDGKEISSLNVNEYRSFIALVSQEPTLYQGTIRDNIVLSAPAEVTDDQIKFASQRATIYDFILSMPEGYNTVVGSKGALFSGAQKQRMAIARAFIRDPKILLFDEPTSALNSESEHFVQAALDRPPKGCTTIAVPHRLSPIQRRDIIYVFDQGRVVDQGTQGELMKRNGAYAELVNFKSLKKHYKRGVR
ncbi:hypothetical protein CHGG_03223 [Chaetomium globosum CBS 148.51]|uniref:Leptomycin B resistance protein pmd1 n=1 Tax=Chaetomium globosum (strain ATCC 6205 / CBS 148.51 / DSM 1962 / NBRC 6347 / NRRL 1970) TaxID=306901 RepID=Q2H981_CHAGB|nr:uncharacterized protein CHGG_03223 [Chaetomium globosum CBS 148.51]EAQ91288.1 hypothetical protein CHGG_03223 [Chaetomium globosum CBS 148.51]